MILSSHPTGNRNVRAVIDGLLKANLLESFHTSFAVTPPSRWLNVLPDKWNKELRRREFALPREKIKQHPIPQLRRSIVSKMAQCGILARERILTSADNLYTEFDRDVATSLRAAKALGVYCYEYSALETFERAAERNLSRFYDLPIAYSETASRLLSEEIDRWPMWRRTLRDQVDSEYKKERKRRELELSQVILCPSGFVAQSIPEWALAGRKVHVCAFGSPPTTTHLRKKSAFGPLRVLFVGSMSQRKGLADLLEAVKILKSPNLELVIMGTCIEELSFYRSCGAHFVYEPPRPHARVLELMRSCDVFCLPSVVEGRALVIQEAMSQGLPVIITENTGAADLVVEGRTGYLVPIRTPEAIADRIQKMLDNRKDIEEMRIAAQQKAAGYTWAAYSASVSRIVGNYIGHKGN